MRSRLFGSAPKGLRLFASGQAWSAFHRSLPAFLRNLPAAARRFWVLTLLAGAAAGVSAVILIDVLRLVQSVAWGQSGSFFDAVTSASKQRRVLVPTAAGFIVVAVAFLTRVRLGGHGTAGIIEAIWRRKGQLSIGRAIVRGLTAIVTVGMGSSLGREGAVLQTGASAASFLARRFGLSSKEARLLVACGACAGIAAAYNVPVGAAVFGLEVLLGSFALEYFGPVVASSVVSTLIAHVLLSDHPTYSIPPYTISSLNDVLRALVLAPLLGVLSAFCIRVVDLVPTWVDRIPRVVVPMLPPIVLCGVGLVSLRFPEILGNGYDTVDDALRGNLPLAALLALPLVKWLATGLSSGVGIPGGLFTPTLFVGALSGAGLSAAAQHVWPSDAASGAYAIVGMAGLLAGTTHAPVSTIILIFELTRNYDVMLPVMLASAIAAATSRRLSVESIYTAPLRRRQIRLPEPVPPEWSETLTVDTLMRSDPPQIGLEVSVGEAVARLLSLPKGADLYVSSREGVFCGALSVDALRGKLEPEGDVASARVDSVVDVAFPAIGVGDSLATAAHRFAESRLEYLPVVDEDKRLVGTLALRDLIRKVRF